MGGKHTRSIPLFERLLIETQANCNRACWFCARTYDRSGKYLDADGRAVLRRMPTETILDLLDQARELGFCGRVGFHHFSEPLLDRRNLELARQVRARGMRPYMHTNGDVLRRHPALACEVAAIYEMVVVGLYDYRTNEERLKEESFWRERLAGTRVEFSAIGLEGRRSGKSAAYPKARVPSDSRMSIPDLVYPNAPCLRPLIRLIVQHDGEVCNCCEDTTGAFSLGNIHRDRLEAIWYGERHLQVIRDLTAGDRENYELCRKCPLGPSTFRPDGKAITFFPRQNLSSAPEVTQASSP